MTNWLTVFRFELLYQLRRKSFLLFTFGVPLLMAGVVLGFTLYQNLRDSAEEESQDPLAFDLADENPIGYLDLSGLFPPPEADSPFAPLITAYDDFESGEAALKAEMINSLYVIEENYLATGEVTQWLNRFSFNAFSDELFLAYLLNNLAEDTSPELMFRLRAPIIQVTEQRIGADGVEAQSTNPMLNFWLVYVFALVMLFSTMASSSYLMQSVTNEKEDHTIEIILTSVRPFPLMLGKVLGAGVAGLLQIAVWLVTGLLLSRIAQQQFDQFSDLEVTPTQIIIALIYFVLGFGFIGAIYASIGALVNNNREGSQLAGWIIFPILIPLFAITIIAENPNGTVAIVMSIFPITAPLAMIMRSVSTTVPLLELALSIIFTSALVVGALWMAGRLFRVTTLLSGSKPKLKDLPKLLLRG